jgi:crotonobetainyl-CoA:carnitine CoA-transferase CaiB-like acyl-CoA transferase
MEGLRVYDATMGIAGPHCTSLMAMCGAEVIKVEPMTGDWCRGIGQQVNGFGGFFLTYNRGKRSIALDLKSDSGRSLAEKLISSCDIVVESFRPGVMKRLGLDYPTLASKRPELIYLSISGFGQTGPYAPLPAFDTVLQAFSGWMHLNRSSRGEPILMDHIAIDVMTGLYAFQACVTALLARYRFRQGAYIDANLMQAAAAFLAPKLTEYILADRRPAPASDAPMGVWPTADGLLAILVLDQQQFGSLCEVLGCSGLATDPLFSSRERRMTNAASLSERLAGPLMARPAAEWEALMRKKGLAAGKVRNFDEFLDDVHVRAVQSVQYVGQPGIGLTPLVRVPGIPLDVASFRGAPRLGEQSKEILVEIGTPMSEIQSLIKDGVVGDVARSAR